MTGWTAAVGVATTRSLPPRPPASAATTVPGTVRWLALGLTVALAAAAAVTLGKSVLERRRDRRRRALEAAVRPALVDRLDGVESDVAAWVEDLAPAERDVLVYLVDRHLAFVVGRDRETLLEIADALGVDDAARAAIESGTRTERLRGLRRLALLDRSVDLDWLAPRLSGSRIERELAVPAVAVETASDRRAVVEFLMAAGPLSVYGLDALSGVLEPDPAPLLGWLADASTDDPALLAQALTVLDRIGPVARGAPLGGVTGLLDHDCDRVRARACTVLAAYGWRVDLRTAVDLESLVGDPSPRVRIAAYRMLDVWGGPSSGPRLKRALDEESDGRAGLVAARALDRSPPGTIARFFAVEPGTEALRDWATDETSIVRRADPLL